MTSRQTRLLRSLLFPSALLLWPVCLEPSTAATVEEALVYVPVQSDVEYDRPSAKEIADCSIKSEKVADSAAWVVRGPAGQILRCFADTNSDNRVDQWCYYSNGIESYRDVDTNYNGKADQYRWLGMSGIRWGLDKDEDGQIDRWKVISPEEVTAEIVGALKDADAARFARVLITQEELRDLGLSKEMTDTISGRLSDAKLRFARAARRQRVVQPRSSWVHFGGTRPGTLPANADGNTKDVIVYENISAMVETDGKPGQVAIGTLVRVGEVWRVTDVPVALMDEQARLEGSGNFFQASLNRSLAQPTGRQSEAINEEMQRLVQQLEKIEGELREARSPKEYARLFREQTALLRQLAGKSSTQDEQFAWIRQLADTLSTAAQSGEYAEGERELERLFEELIAQSPESELTGSVKFRLLTTQYSLKLQDAKPDFPKTQDWWVESLEAFVKDFPTGEDALEAMLQLAIAEEFAGREEPALGWYERIIGEGEPGLVVNKARGAQRRLTSDGQPLSLRGTATSGKKLDVGQFVGRPVLIHYWATWCEPCKQDIETIAKLVSTYGNQFVPVGVCLDSDDGEIAAFLRTNRINWPQLYEEGGLDSRLAVELGILTVPTMLLLDEDGNVFNRNIHIEEVEAYLEKNLR